MTQSEKLEALIERAFDRGWEFDNLDKWKVTAIKKQDTVMNNWYQFRFEYDQKVIVIDAERILFDHYFAKALWGEEKLSRDDLHAVKKEGDIFYSVDLIPVFQYRLQQAVIADSPIDYMYEVTFGKES